MTMESHIKELSKDCRLGNQKIQITSRYKNPKYKTPYQRSIISRLLYFFAHTGDYQIYGSIYRLTPHIFKVIEIKLSFFG
jgi:hypothetical protein